MSKSNLNIVYLGSSGFPIGLAEIQKLKLVSKSLVAGGNTVLVINRVPRHPISRSDEVQKQGVVEGVQYTYTSGTPIKSKSFFKRNFLKLHGAIQEVLLLIKLSRKNQLDAAIISSKSFALIVLYSLLGKLLNFVTILNFAEFNSELSKEKGENKRLNDQFFERYAFGLVDGVLPISDFLVEMLKEKNPDKPYFKIPVMCDFSEFQGIEKYQENPYFLFCGGPNFGLINFILDAFDQVDDSSYYLYLVVNGSDKQLGRLRSEISKRNKSKLVRTFAKLPYGKLVELYLGADGLLIPMRPSLRDRARFPHKIGEYCAASNPIITTNYGEISNYFTDGRDALIADEFDIRQFAEKMKYVIDEPENSGKIGEEGYRLGMENFNYISYGPKLEAFVRSLM